MIPRGEERTPGDRIRAPGPRRRRFFRGSVSRVARHTRPRRPLNFTMSSCRRDASLFAGEGRPDSGRGSRLAASSSGSDTRARCYRGRGSAPRRFFVTHVTAHGYHGCAKHDKGENGDARVSWPSARTRTRIRVRVCVP